jgi:hypothetical protein
MSYELGAAPQSESILAYYLLNGSGPAQGYELLSVMAHSS